MADPGSALRRSARLVDVARHVSRRASVTIGGVFTTRRVARVPLTPTSMVPQTKPTTHTHGSSVNCSENRRRAKIQPTEVAPRAAKVPDRNPSAENSAATPCNTVPRLAPSVRSIALS